MDQKGEVTISPHEPTAKTPSNNYILKAITQTNGKKIATKKTYISKLVSPSSYSKIFL